MGNIGPFEIVLVLAIALLAVGPKKLPELTKSVGKGVREFKDALDPSNEPKSNPTAAEPAAAQPVTAQPVAAQAAAAPPAEPAVPPAAAPAQPAAETKPASEV
jgi:sec-independent protein translocase protein TatA